MEIALGGKNYTIRPLTLGQIEALGIAESAVFEGSDPMAAKDPREFTRRSWARNIEVISVALSRDYPDMTPDALRQIETTPQEIIAAHDAILLFSGFVKKEDKAPGEAAAEAA